MKKFACHNPVFEEVQKKKGKRKKSWKKFLQLTTKLNPSPLTFDSPKVIFESHDLHFVILLKVVNSDTNSITLYAVADLLFETSRFKG